MFAQGQAGVHWPNGYFFTFGVSVGKTLQGYPNATIAQTHSEMYPPSCAWLEVGKDSTNRGMLIPRVVVVSGITSPVRGLITYEISTAHLKMYNGTSWIRVDSSGGGSSFDTTSIYTAINARVPMIRTITINGVTQDLSANRTWTITSPSDSTTAGYGLSEVGNRIDADTTQLQRKVSAGTGINITGNVVSSTGVLTEVDPVFAASDAFGVTNSLIANWNASYNDRVNSLAFTGTGTKTLTLTQQDAGTVTNTFTDLGADTSIWATQSDLTTGYVPYTGATGSVDLGTNNITTTGFVNTTELQLQGGAAKTSLRGSASGSDKVQYTPNITDTLTTNIATQTLTHKTIISPFISDFTNATHNHSNATGGGQIGINAINATGTPSASTYLDGSGAWSTPSGGGSTLSITTPLTGTSYNGSSPVTIGLAGLTTLGAKNQVPAMNAAANAYEYHTAGGLKLMGATVSPSVNQLATGVTSLFTTNTGNGDFVVTQIFITTISLTGIPVGTFQGTIRWGGATPIASFSLSVASAGAVGRTTNVGIPNGTLVVPANSLIEVSATTAFTVATVMTCQIDLIGYYKQ